MEQPDGAGESLFVAGRGNGSPDGYVIRMAGETVRPERDHHVGFELAEEPRRQIDQYLTVDVSQPAVRIVKASGLGESQVLTRSLEFTLPDCRQRRPGRRASVADLPGAPLGQGH